MPIKSLEPQASFYQLRVLLNCHSHSSTMKLTKFSTKSNC